jgi:hypothetical protein
LCKRPSLEALDKKSRAPIHIPPHLLLSAINEVICTHTMRTLRQLRK